MPRPTTVITWLNSRKVITFQRIAIALAGLLALEACTALPNSGPRADTFNKAQWQYVTAEDGKDALPFVLVDVDPKVLETLISADADSYFKGSFTDRSPAAEILLGPGDIIRVTIFEAGPGGLFSSGASSNVTGGGNFVTLPDQEIDQSGHITVPYADKDSDGGRIKVAGRRIADVQKEIQQRLLNKAIEPQVIVTLVKRTSNLYSVIGDVNAPGRFSLDQGGSHILDALSAAGGPKDTDYNTLVTLQRGDTSATARLSEVLHDPENNIFVQPGDMIAVKKDERFYNVLGATHSNSRVPFEAEKVTVADALAKAGGLDSSMAEPAAVVVFRREKPETLEAMGIKLDGAKADEPVATIYRFNLNEPTGMFLAQKMQLRNDDVVYVSNDTFSDVSKLVGILRDVLLIKLFTK